MTDFVVRTVAQSDQSVLAARISEMAKGEHSRYRDVPVVLAANDLEEGVAALFRKGARG